MVMRVYYKNFEAHLGFARLQIFHWKLRVGDASPFLFFDIHMYPSFSSSLDGMIFYFVQVLVQV